MVMIVVAGLNALLYYWKVQPLVAGWTADTESPAIARAVAYTSLAAWSVVLICGRLIPYVGTG